MFYTFIMCSERSKSKLHLNNFGQKNTLLLSSLQYNMRHILHTISLHNIPVYADICRNVALINRWSDDRTVDWTWSSLGNCFPSICALSLPNRWMSQGTRLGLYGEYCQTSHPKLRSKYGIVRALWYLTLSYQRIMPLLNFPLLSFFADLRKPLIVWLYNSALMDVRFHINALLATSSNKIQ